MLLFKLKCRILLRNLFARLLFTALNETLREEVNRLKLEAGQLPLLNGMNYNTSLAPQYSSHRQPLHHFANPNPHQPQPQKSQMPNSNTTGRLKPTFMDFN